MNETDLVPVLVPKHLVTGVYGWIAANLGGSTGIATNTCEPEDGSKLHKQSEVTVRKLVSESPPAMKDILRTMANASPKEVTTVALARSLQHKPGAKSITIAGTLGAFGRRFKHRHAGQVKPFEQRWDHAEGTNYYRMDPEVATWVLKFLG